MPPIKFLIDRQQYCDHLYATSLVLHIEVCERRQITVVAAPLN